MINHADHEIQSICSYAKKYIEEYFNRSPEIIKYIVFFDKELKLLLLFEAGIDTKTGGFAYEFYPEPKHKYIIKIRIISITLDEFSYYASDRLVINSKYYKRLMIVERDFLVPNKENTNG